MKLFVIAFCLILASVFSSPAADVRVTGLGQTNYFPVWRNGNSVTTNSQIYQSGTLIGIGTTNPSVQLEVSEGVTTEPRGVMTSQYSTGTNGARLSFRKARGTQSAPTIVVSGDLLGALNGWVYDGANYLNMAGIEFGTTGTIAATRVPTEMRFYTATDALPSVKTLRLTINNSGTATFANSVTVTASLLASGNAEVKGRNIETPLSLQTLAAGTAINAVTPTARIVGSGGPIVSTATPIIADGSEGQVLRVFGTSAVNTVTLTDETGLPGSNLELNAATRVMGLGSILVLYYDSTTTKWFEQSYSANP